MYYRIKNKFEVDMLCTELQSSEIPTCVIERMNEVAEILDDNYGAERSSKCYGGYLLFFPTSSDYNMYAPVIMQNYGIDPNLYEFDDILSETQNKNWRERLYLLSSDDSLVFIYMQ